MVNIGQMKDRDGNPFYPKTHVDAVEGLEAVQDKTFEYSQLMPADSWAIEHNLGKMAAVTIVDSSGTQVVGEVKYTDKNNLIVSFSAAFSGKAYLN